MTGFQHSAPAKINLALHVTGRRADGYHELESLVVFADIADRLRISSSSTDQFSVSGPFAKNLDDGQDNLVSSAIEAFRKRWPQFADSRFAVELEKNLPIAAGIGGGSADAAAMLRYLALANGIDLADEKLRDVALTLGADVPVCLMSKPCVMRGIGDRVERLGAFPDCHLVLVNPLLPVSTPEIFENLQSTKNPGLPELPERFADARHLAEWLAATRNDLTKPAIELVPIIGELIATLGDHPECLLARMSGSGATLFGLFESAKAAQQAERMMKEKHPECWVVASSLFVPDQ